MADTSFLYHLVNKSSWFIRMGLTICAEFLLSGLGMILGISSNQMFNFASGFIIGALILGWVIRARFPAPR